jgi:hypothetical protein
MPLDVHETDLCAGHEGAHAGIQAHYMLFDEPKSGSHHSNRSDCSAQHHNLPMGNPDTAKHPWNWFSGCYEPSMQ